MNTPRPRPAEPTVKPPSARSIDSTAYDTAWVASLPDPADPRRPRFPGAMQWLLDHQLPDGSWGGEIRYEHDRIISTLSALAALLSFRRGDREARAIEDGQRYLWRRAKCLPRDVELVGFELLLPMLMQKVQRLGTKLPPELDVYQGERARKRALIPPEMLYSPKVTIVHSLEFLGDDVDVERLHGAQGENGSIGNSPAATAFFLHTSENTGAVDYLEACLSGAAGAAAPVLHPCETFDLLWTAYHRFLGEIPVSELLSEEERASLGTSLDEGKGISLSPSFPIPDADDTAIGIRLLGATGRATSAAALTDFEREGHYASYHHERSPSTGVNIHVLEALKWAQPAPEKARIAKVISFLADQRQHDAYWLDKWHISPYYVTAHAIVALDGVPDDFARVADEFIRAALGWVRDTQKADGSWGFHDSPTAEETGYALIALTRGGRFEQRGDREAIRRGLASLGKLRHAPLPPLWIDKCLYTPPHIVAAVIEAAERSAVRLLSS